MVHFVAIDRLRLRNVYGEGVLAGCDAFERYLFRNDVGARAPVRAREIGRSDRLLHFLLRIALLADVGSHTLLEPYTRSRVEAAERCAVVAPRSEAVNLLAIYREDVLLLYKLVAAVVSAVTSHDVLHAHVLCVLRQSEVGGDGLASEDVRILLTDVVDRVDERQHLRALHTVATDIALSELQFDACQVTLLGPCVDEHADVSLVLKQRVAVGDVLLPLHAVLPLRYVNRAALRCKCVVVVAVEAHTERSHKAHQLDGRQIVLAGDDAAHVLQLQRVNLGELSLALSDAQQVDGRVARQYKYRARLVPTVAV